jgi:prepilin-type processing-associated H-X9-DG protein
LEVDNASNYVLSHVGEMPSAGYPGEINNFSSGHAGGIMYLLADGHVQFLTSGTSSTTLKALATRSGGEAPTGDF